jgi:hypothetical protein
MEPKLYDLQQFLNAGIDPKTGLPTRIDADTCYLKSNIKKALRILDEQNAINRYVWYNLPNGLDGQLLERILYYRGQGMFFYMPTDETFYFLPYALDGTIDVYGRFKGVTPLPFNGTSADKEEKAWITGLTRKPIYDIIVDAEINPDILEDGCVLLSDYSKQISQTNISRQIIQDPILDTMAEAFPFARTSLISNSGVKGMRVNDEDQKATVKLASKSVTKAALNGDPWIPVVGNIEWQELTDGTALKSEEFLIYMQALDNFRLSLYGLSNGGLFQKKSHMLESEQQMNEGNVGLVYQDGLTLRQKFCDIVNSIWGLGIWCEASEIVVGIDQNMDGEIADNQDQSGEMAGEQPMGVNSDE